MVDLSGIWRFFAEDSNGELNLSRAENIIESSTPMAVPGSYNEQTVDASLKEHVGWVWYQTDLMAP
ncbi:hypothetical protein, partial [Okeania sp. SIO1H5]|uniref:hypothetical protein n=1 Tax=Okeania sp. SIO1H5 TaxID=2607777 RepID=UPI00257E166B